MSTDKQQRAAQPKSPAPAPQLGSFSASPIEGTC